jgi:hypothetical protein
MLSIITRTLRLGVIPAVALLAVVQTVAAQDLTPPELAAISVAPAAIDVSSGAANVVVTATIKDNLSGFSFGSIRLISQSGTLLKFTSFGAFNRVSGDGLNGVYESSIEFPQFTQGGMWTMHSAQLADVTTNTRYYNAADLAPFGLQVDVTSNTDSVAPEITALSISPTSVDLSSGTANVSVTIGVSDDLSGFASGVVFLRGPSTTQARSAFFNVNQLTAGDAFDGTYLTTMSLPQFGETGDWVAQVRLADKATNAIYLATDVLVSQGFSPQLAVTSTPQDVSAPSVVQMDRTPAIANTILSPDNVDFLAQLTDNLSGVQSLSFRTTSPSGGQNHWMYMQSSSRTSGDTMDGIYETSKEYPRYSEFGEWTVNYMNIGDQTGNRAVMTQTDLDAMGLSVSFLMEGAITGGGGVFPIPEEGAVVETDDGGLTMNFPPGALDEDTEVTATKVGRFEPVNIFVGTNHDRAKGTVLAEYDFTPDGIIFGEPVTVEVTVDVTALDEYRRSLLNVYQFIDSDDDGVLDTFEPIPQEHIISVVTTEPDENGKEYMIFTFILEHFSSYAIIEEIEDVDDTTPPNVSVTVPAADQTIQDDVVMVADATDDSPIAGVTFTIREVPLDDGVVGMEQLPGTPRPGTDEWELLLDSTQLLDGCYTVVATAIDELGNERTSDAVRFSIRNWSMSSMLPMSASYNAGRTIPIKFEVRVDAAIDPATPFVLNEELVVHVYETSNAEELLQESFYGDASRDYRVNAESEHYITNFKTSKTPMQYTVEIRRLANDHIIGSFEFETED